MANVARALLVGSSFSAAPIFFALKRHGLHVSVCGSTKSDPCHQYADASYFVDYSNPENLRGVLESSRFDYLVPTCNDYAYMACAQNAEKYGYPGFDALETAATLHTKNKFRRAMNDLGLPAPSYTLVQRGETLDPACLPFPLLTKPVDSFSGRGMTKVAEPLGLQQAIRKAFDASRTGDSIVLEQFLEGGLYSHSAFIEDRQVVADFFVDEFCTVYPFQVNCSNHPSTLNDTVQGSVRSAIEKLAGAFGLVDGLLHTQFISNGCDFWIIETMRRCPGDLYGTLIQFSTGVDYADLFVRPFLDLKMPTLPPETSTRFFGRHTISVSESLVSFSFSQSIPAVGVDILPLKNCGERLAAAPFDKLAILFAEFASASVMQELTPRLAEYIHIRKHGEQLS